MTPTIANGQSMDRVKDILAQTRILNTAFSFVKQSGKYKESQSEEFTRPCPILCGHLLLIFIKKYHIAQSRNAGSGLDVGWVAEMGVG